MGITFKREGLNAGGMGSFNFEAIANQYLKVLKFLWCKLFCSKLIAGFANQSFDAFKEWGVSINWLFSHWSHLVNLNFFLIYF